MPDMTEWDQEQYGAGYGCAEFDIQTHGYAYAEANAANYSTFDNTDNKHTWFVGYITCVQAWKEGVRL